MNVNIQLWEAFVASNH